MSLCHPLTKPCTDWLPAGALWPKGTQRGTPEWTPVRRERGTRAEKSWRQQEGGCLVVARSSRGAQGAGDGCMYTDHMSPEGAGGWGQGCSWAWSLQESVCPLSPAGPGHQAHTAQQRWTQGRRVFQRGSQVSGVQWGKGTLGTGVGSGQGHRDQQVRTVTDSHWPTCPHGATCLPSKEGRPAGHGHSIPSLHPQGGPSAVPRSRGSGGLLATPGLRGLSTSRPWHCPVGEGRNS